MPESSKSLDASFVYDALLQTQKLHRDEKKYTKKAKYAYESRLWEGEEVGEPANGTVVVEVPRMPGIIDTYTGYLFPRSPRVVITPDVDGESGSPEKAQLAINRWFASNDVRKRIHKIIGQALLYEGGYIKFVLDMSKKRVQARVQTRIVPWWEGVEDSNVNDWSQVRYRGHAYWEDRDVLRKRLGDDIRIPEDAVGRDRVPYFSTNDDGLPTRDSIEAAGSKAGGRFIHVLEWYNFIDDWTFQAENGETVTTKGRFEIYLVNDLGKEGARPIFEGAMPLSDYDGEPLCNLVPLIFSSEMDQPLKGIPLSRRVYAQCYELAMLRTAQANAVRKDARVLLVNTASGAGETDIAKVAMGQDGATIPVEKPQGVPWEDMYHFIKFPNMNGNYQLYQQDINGDLDRGANVARFSQGEALGSRTTATEVNRLTEYMQNHLGENARVKDEWCEDVARVLLRALIRAMRNPIVMSDGEQKEPDTITITEGTAERRNIQTITVDDLDANFEIHVVDAASTPLTREARRQVMLSLVDVLLKLWAEIEKGNPAAEATLNSLVEYFELPADFDAGSLRSRKAEMTGEAASVPDTLIKAITALPDEFWQNLLSKFQQPGGLPPEKKAVLDKLRDAMRSGQLQPPPGAGLPEQPMESAPTPPVSAIPSPAQELV